MAPHRRVRRGGRIVIARYPRIPSGRRGRVYPAEGSNDCAGARMNYVNPLGQIKNLIAERVDQGVDFSGSGPILAIGNGTVIETNGGGWPGGPFMSYRLDDGPDAGKVVYVAENIRPTVAKGQKIKAGQPIATMFEGGTGIEMGWADASGTIALSQTPAAGGISGANLPAGGTEVGR